MNSDWSNARITIRMTISGAGGGGRIAPTTGNPETCLDGLLTATKVAREFEFAPLRHSVLDVGYSLRSLPKIRAYRPNLHLLRHQRQASSNHSVRNSALYLCFELVLHSNQANG